MNRIAELAAKHSELCLRNSLSIEETVESALTEFAAGEPVLWIRSDCLHKITSKQCGSQSMFARVSDHKLQPDYIPLSLYAAPRAEPTNSTPGEGGSIPPLAGAAPTPETDMLCPTLNLSYIDLQNAAHKLREHARRLERERDEAIAQRDREFELHQQELDKRVEAESALAENKKLLYEIGYAIESHGYAHMTNGEGIASLLGELAALQKRLDDAGAEIARLLDALHCISLGSQNSGTRKEDLGKEARAAIDAARKEGGE